MLLFITLKFLPFPGLPVPFLHLAGFLASLVGLLVDFRHGVPGQSMQLNMDSAMNGNNSSTNKCPLVHASFWPPC